MSNPIPEKNFTTADVVAAAGCSPVTFRAWRNRNGLFPETKNREGWNRFSVADICTVRVVAVLTSKGVAAQFAISTAMEILPQFQLLLYSKWRQNRIGKIRHYAVVGDWRGEEGNEALTPKVFFFGGVKTLDEVMNDSMACDVVFTIDLQEIIEHVIEQLQAVVDIDGKPSNTDATVMVLRALAKGFQPDPESTDDEGVEE